LNIKKKIGLYTATGMVGISLIIGGSTFALFTDSASNTNNTFKAGTLDVTAERDDVPNYGPMFYTNSPDNGNVVGAMPTGYWAPGDKHTRALFLENTGSLEAKLKSVSIIPTNSTNTEVNASSTGNDLAAYNDAVTFGKQADVIIWNIKRAGFLPPLSPSDMDVVNEGLTYAYEQWILLNPNFSFLDDQQKAEALNFINSAFLAWINTRGNDTNSIVGNIDNMHKVKLENLLSTPFNASPFGISIEAGESAMLGFTVDFLKNPPAGSGLDPNSMQGKNVYLTFKTDWEQADNN
jgi:spore coat-associated protein N